MARKLVILLGLLILTAGILPVGPQSDQAQAHKEAIRSALDAFSASNPDALFNLFPESYQMNQGDATLEAMSRSDAEAYFKVFAGAMPDLKVTSSVLLAQGDEVAAELVFSGTFSQPFNFSPISPDPVKPTNQPILWSEMDFFHFTDAGLIDQQWSFSDPSVLFGQLGVFPAQNNDADGTLLKSLAGYQTLSADQLAATFTSGQETRNLALINQQNALGIGNFPQFYTDPYVSRSNGQTYSVTASDVQQNSAFTDALKQAAAAAESGCLSVCQLGNGL